MLVSIGSTNPCKIAAVKNIILKAWPQAKFVFHQVDSRVSFQPIGDGQIIKGATNRAQKALLISQADLGVGLEGGLRKIKGSLYTTAWCAVVDRKGKISLGGGLIMPLPKKVTEKISQGGELGPVMDEIYGIKDVKKKMGAVGILTKNITDRVRAYEVIVSYALVKFLNPEIDFS